VPALSCDPGPDPSIAYLVYNVNAMSRGQPVDERRDNPFPYSTPGQYAFGAFLTALSLVAVGVGRVAVLGGRVVAKTWHRGQDRTS